MDYNIDQVLQSPRFCKTSGDGPLSASRLRRTNLFFLGLGIAGLLPTLLGMSGAWQATGLGLLMPGAGFIAVGGWAALLFVLTYVLYLAALVVWFGSGNILAPIVIWLGSALLAGAMMGTGDVVWSPAVYLVLLLVCAREFRAYAKKQKAFKAGIEKRDARKTYLKEAIARVEERAVAAPAAGTRELTPTQLESIRYVFDRALQPVGEYKGFTIIDQFQTSALRYQLNNVGYTLSTMQCFYTPNFHGYLNQAQQNAISQMLKKKVWGYWPLENMWGNFSFNFDPCGKDNIMLTGFYGLQICLYMSSSGDRRYAEPGSLTFVYNDNKVYKHDIHSVIGSIVKNYAEQEFTLYPCEPNWVYTPCNFMGMKALAIYDRLFGTSHFKKVFAGFIDKLDAEFTQVDASIMALRSNLTGFAVPFPFGDDGRSLFFHPIEEYRAKEAYALAREEMTHYVNGKLTIKLEGKGIDMGNYTRGHAATVQNILAAAREFGDNELAATAVATLNTICDSKLEDGVRTYNASNSTNLTLARALILEQNDWRNAILHGPETSTLKGPILTGINYPDVLVAKAFSHTGTDLELVLYPGKSDGLQSLTIERLQAEGDYILTEINSEQHLKADNNGSLTVTVMLSGRTTLTLKPA